MPQLVLASTSPFRRQLLERLKVPFDIVSPHTDETPLSGETPLALVRRLAIAKAQAVAADARDQLVIGSDQVALHNGDIVGKPHTVENAVKHGTRCDQRVERARAVRRHPLHRQVQRA